MRLHRLDWLLLLIAAAAVTWGVVVNPTLDYVDAGIPYGSVDWRLPWELITGVAVGAVALAVVAVRSIRRSN
jgi:hypothetical protein